jgi:quinol-cytochrome oxidoreductase complex cytochrome b subunit
MSRFDKLVGALEAFYRWIDDRYKATAIAGIRFTFPGNFSYFLSNLGMATVICFLVTIVTGIPLMMYYRPTPWNVAYDSIEFITNKVVFGALLRGIHYHASNGMVALSVIHAAYVFFKRLYKGRFDFLWVTGVVLAVLTVFAAFTGYVLIFNDRAVEAQNIMLGITEAIHPALKFLMAGTGLSDRALRLYAFHIGLLPLLIGALLSVHLPRALRISVPTIVGVFALLFIATSIYPAELGPKYNPAVTPEFMPPEWYFLWIFTLLRTWAPVIYIGVLLPLAMLVIAAFVPWLDVGRKPKLTDRPITSIIGISGFAFWIYLTFRGTMGVGPPALQVPLLEVLGAYVIILIGSGVAFRLYTTVLARKPGVKRPTFGYLKGNIATLLLLVIVCVQVALVWAFSSAYIIGNNRLTSLNIGLILLGLGMAQHIYSVASRKS